MGEKPVQKPTLGPNDVWIDAELVRSALPRRQPGAHKWGVGGLIVVAGAPQYVGAAILSSTAAARAGAGVVVVASSRAVCAAVVQRLPEAVTLPLPESESATGTRRIAEQIDSRLERAAALVIGPGLGDDEATTGIMRALIGGGGGRERIGFGLASQPGAADAESGGLLQASGKPTVIDADGLNWLAKQPDWWTLLPPRQLVLTPHLGEFSRLRETDIDAVLADPVTAAREAARDWQQTVLLKSAYVVVTDGDKAFVVPDAPTALATAGTGDVLAGTIGAFLAQGLPPVKAATLAVHVGNQAAAAVARELGTLGLLASDLPHAIAVELGRLERAGEATDG